MRTGSRALSLTEAQHRYYTPRAGHSQEPYKCARLARKCADWPMRKPPFRYTLISSPYEAVRRRFEAVFLERRWTEILSTSYHSGSVRARLLSQPLGI